jgi:hypothetical protein
MIWSEYCRAIKEVPINTKVAALINGCDGEYKVEGVIHRFAHKTIYIKNEAFVLAYPYQKVISMSVDSISSSKQTEGKQE